MDNSIEEYIAAHIDAEPEELYRLYRRTHLRHLYPRMCSGHYQGRLLKMLTAMVSPIRVLELGAYTGYSTLCIAEGMGPGGVIDTVEIDDEMAPELLETFDACRRPGVEIRLHVGDALEVVPMLEGQWDMVFIDANKRHYTRYLDMVRERVPVGGFILADNTLWDGHIIEAEYHDAQSAGIAAFNDAVAADANLEKVILPVRDGLTLIRRIG